MLIQRLTFFILSTLSVMITTAWAKTTEAIPLQISEKPESFSKQGTQFEVDENGSIHGIISCGKMYYITNKNGIYESILIDSSDDEERVAAFAIDKNSAIHIVYWNNQGQKLNYVSNSTGNWVTEVVSTPDYFRNNMSSDTPDSIKSTFSSVYDLAITTDSTKSVFISYITNNNVRACCARKVTGIWQNEVVAFLEPEITNSISQIAISAESDAFIVISYVKKGSYISATDTFFCAIYDGIWSFKRLLLSPDVGNALSMELDSSHRIIITFTDKFNLLHYCIRSQDSLSSPVNIGTIKVNYMINVTTTSPVFESPYRYSILSTYANNFTDSVTFAFQRIDSTGVIDTHSVSLPADSGLAGAALCKADSQQFTGCIWYGAPDSILSFATITGSLDAISVQTFAVLTKISNSTKTQRDKHRSFHKKMISLQKDGKLLLLKSISAINKNDVNVYSLRGQQFSGKMYGTHSIAYTLTPGTYIYKIKHPFGIIKDRFIVK